MWNSPLVQLESIFFTQAICSIVGCLFSTCIVLATMEGSGYDDEFLDVIHSTHVVTLFRPLNCMTCSLDDESMGLAF